MSTNSPCCRASVREYKGCSLAGSSTVAQALAMAALAGFRCRDSDWLCRKTLPEKGTCSSNHRIRWDSRALRAAAQCCRYRFRRGAWSPHQNLLHVL